MALRNAFEAIATEGTLRRLLEQLRFAKDSSDRMRVTVDVMPTTTVTLNAGSAISAPYAAGSWNLMDQRQEMQEMTLQTFQATRNRWSIT